MRKPDRKWLSIADCSHEPDFGRCASGARRCQATYGPRQKFLAEMAANDALLKDKQARPAEAELAWAR
jgi:hypothetical protein